VRFIPQNEINEAKVVRKASYSPNNDNIIHNDNPIFKQSIKNQAFAKKSLFYSKRVPRRNNIEEEKKFINFQKDDIELNCRNSILNML
jgi:hypothetical protein